MRWSVRRLPPVLKAVWLLALVAMLASLSLNIWVIQDLKRGEVPQHLQGVALVLLALGLTYNWMVTTYNLRHPTRIAPIRRPRRSAPWLDTGRGQLITAFVGSAIPLATLVALVVFPDAPYVVWAVPVNVIFLFLWMAALLWATL